MGLSELVVAPASEAESVAQTDAPSQPFDRIDIKGVDTVKFGTLHSILTGQSFEDLLDLYEPVVTVDDDEGPWVFQLPPDLVAALAALNDTATADVARQWASTEEFELDDWTEDEVHSVLTTISSLARKAVESQQVLFLWQSL